MSQNTSEVQLAPSPVRPPNNGYDPLAHRHSRGTMARDGSMRASAKAVYLESSRGISNPVSESAPSEKNGEPDGPISRGFWFLACSSRRKCRQSASVSASTGGCSPAPQIPANFFRQTALTACPMTGPTIVPIHPPQPPPPGTSVRSQQ